MICFEKDYITIYCDPSKRLIQLEWHAFANSEQYREALQTALVLVKKHNVDKWLANSRHMKAIRQQDQDWTINVWFPELVNTGIKKLATVVSDDIFNQMAVSNIMSKVKPILNFNHQYFTNIFSALDWLEQ